MRRVNCRRQNLHRVAAHAGRGMSHGGTGSGTGGSVSTIQHTQPVQCPQRVNRSHIQIDGIDTRVARHLDQLRNNVPLTALHQQSLGLPPPQQRRMTQRGNQLLRSRTTQGIRPRWLSGVMHNPIDAAVFLVAQVGRIRVALTAFETMGSWVVLHNVVVPVEHPDISVRTNFRHDRRRPLIVAGQQIERTGCLEIRSPRAEHECAHQMSGGTVHKRSPIPVLPRIAPCRIQRMTGSRRVAAKLVHLPHLVGDRFEQERIGDRAQCQRRLPAAHALVVPVGDRHVHTGIAVRRGTENQALFADAQAPGVVVGRTDELQPRTVGTKTEKAHAKGLLTLPIEYGCRIVVALHGPDPVVQTVLKIADPAVGVSQGPIGNQHPPFIRAVVAVRVPQIQRLGTVLHNHAAAMKDHAAGNAQALGKHRESIGDPVPVGVLADPDAITALSRRLQFVRIVNGLRHPQPSPLVPGHRQRLAPQLRLGGKQLHLKSLRHNQVFERFIGSQWLLHSTERLPLSAPLIRPGIVGDLLSHIDKGERFDVRALRIHPRHGKGTIRQILAGRRRVLTGRPANAAFDQILETRMAPSALIMAPRCIEHASLAVCADPGPWLATLIVDTDGQHRAILLVVQMMHVGLVPALEPSKTPHDRMFALHNLGTEHSRTMAFELASHQSHHFRHISKTVGGAVQRHKSVASGNIAQQCPGLIRGNRVDVGIQNQHVVFRQRVRIQILHVVGVHQIDAPRGQHGLQLRKAQPRPVVPIVTQKQPAKLGGRTRRGPANGGPASDRHHDPRSGHRLRRPAGVQRIVVCVHVWESSLHWVAGGR